MLLTMLILFFFLSVPILILFLLHDPRKPNRLPPGPRPLPIIGNLHQMGPLLHRTFHRLSKLHGPLLHLRLGRRHAVVISSPSLAEQVLKTQDLSCCSRPLLASFREHSYDASDVAAAPYGDHWRNLRKIFTQELLGANRLPSFRSVREKETFDMIRSISTRPDPDSAVNVSELMVRLGSSVINRVAFGYKDDVGGYGERSRFQGMLEELQELLGSFWVGNFFPGFGWVDVVTGIRGRMKRNAKELDGFYQELIDQHLIDSDDQKTKLDIVDGAAVEEDILHVMLRLWKNGEGNITMDAIKGSLLDIINGGTDTTAGTLTWTMAELARNPRVLKKAQDEVRSALGNKGRVEESDLLQLHYLKLVVTETLRFHPPVPLLLPRETSQPTNLDGYDIPPKTLVFVNAWAMGRDEEYWENPEVYDPDRFLRSSVDYKGHHFHFLPFGSGRRICPGMNFGVTGIELPLANLLYAFDWELPPGMDKEDIDMTESTGIATNKKIALYLVAKNPST